MVEWNKSSFKNNAKVILDYAHTPDALENCLVNIKEQFKIEKLILFLDVEEKRDKPKRQLMGYIANKYSKKIYLTDDNPRKENPSIIRNQVKKN